MGKLKVKVDRSKLKREYPFLYFLVNNENVQQTRDVLTLDATKHQYIVLRELAVNELANNIPAYTQPKRKKELKKKNLIRLKKLAQGTIKYQNLGALLPLLRLIIQDAIIHHGLKGKKTGHRTTRAMGEDDERESKRYRNQDSADTHG